MQHGDLPALMEIAAAAHPDFPEDEAVFAERLRLFPAGCRTLVGARGRLYGYVLSHPWQEALPVPLDSLLATLPARPETLYLHDLALLPGARGSGAAGEVVRELLGLARGLGLHSVSLVAVSGSAGFWGRQGFEARSTAARELRCYGDDAVFMVHAFAGAET
ncbi:GNAT family N-acetyltransferase [Ramlibacter monticola]|uniref:GNAT family N-acetyltransferase n=1 Tax=Ramlibacter monticola TaxID=1926872 RepID=A0A936Z2F4_9BURK|nr:GNAT family N-acetyltransferase [Ramlibacter monticola]MBL0392606.1 GNAT family N-acetyltransferase [Ramlibacter monticola]